ncbi:MAG: hypothetical protein GX241_01915 [Ruminococcaceae bacterium]|nr:hypothetical protein [Oscillospiraceae bacterium]
MKKVKVALIITFSILTALGGVFIGLTVWVNKPRGVTINFSPSDFEQSI